MAPGSWPLPAGIYSIENYAAICPMYLDKLESASETYLRVTNNLVNGVPRLDVSQLWILRKVTIDNTQCYTIQNYATETYLQLEGTRGANLRYPYCSPTSPPVNGKVAWLFQQQSDQTYKIYNVNDPTRFLEVENCPPRDQVQKDRNIINGKYVQTWTDEGQEAARWYCNKFEDYAPCNWMANLSDTTLLRDLTNPATHQTSSLDTTVGPSAQMKQSPKCQDSGVYCQLRQGIRYLDVRIDVNVEEMRVVHGVWAMDTPFTQVLSQIWEFLDTYKSEVVILNLNRDSGGPRITGEDTFLNTLRDCLRPWWSMFARGAWENPLSMFRGKCFFVTGDHINQLRYRQLSWGYTPRDSDMLDAIAMPTSYLYDPIRWDGQDLFTDLSVAEKMARVQEHLTAAMDTANNGNRAFYTGLNMSKLMDYYPRQRSDALNPLLQTFLDGVTRTTPRARLGIIGLDFYTEQLVRTMIRFNGVTIADSVLIPSRVNSTQ